MRVNKALIAALVLAQGAALALATGAAHAEVSACGPQALGVSRTITIGDAPQVGLKTYPRTLDLADHEVALTFDDGPGATTGAVLDALKAQCATATFFLIGRNAAGMPALVRREIAEGHTVGHHSNTHPERTLRALPLDRALADIDAGVAAVQKAAGGKASNFFRFPGFGDSPALLAALEAKKMATFGADLWASDWNPMSPQQELDLLMERLRRSGGGIVLLHDIKQQTAEMLPMLLVKLKEEGFHLVRLQPGDTPAPLRKAAEGWVSETDATLQKMGIDGAPAPAERQARKKPKPRTKAAAPAPTQEQAPMQEQAPGAMPE